MKHNLRLLLISLIVCMLLQTTSAFGIEIMPMPDLVVNEISLDSANHITFTVSNQGKGVLPKGWIAVAEVSANQEKLGNISLNAPTSTKNGGLEAAGGSAFYSTSLTLSKEAYVSVFADATQDVAEANEKNNSLTAQLVPEITPPPVDLPDLAVGNLRISEGKLAFTVSNIGKGTMPKGWSASADIFLDGLREVTISLNAPASVKDGGLEAAGGSADYKTNLTIKESTVVLVIADSTQAVAETNEQNNSASQELSPQPDPPGTDLPLQELPDLRVAGVTTAADNRLAIMIQNTGKVNLPSGTRAVAEIHIGGQSMGFIDLGKPTESFFGGIGAGGGFSSYLLDYVMPGAAKVSVLVDSTSRIDESDEQNNAFSGTVTLSEPFEKDFGDVAVRLSFAIDQLSYRANEKSLLMDVAPVILESRTFMPLRYVAEAVGSEVFWDGDKSKVTVIKGLKTIELWIGGNIARINGTAVYIDPMNPKVMPFIKNSRTYLPLRFVSEVLGGKVGWDQETRGIQIDFSEAAIDDDVTWSVTDSLGNVTIDDDVTWNRFEMGVASIDDDVTWMTDGRILWHTKLIQDKLYEPNAIIDPTPPSKPAEIMDPSPPH